MLIDAIEVHQVQLPLVTPFNTAYGDTHVVESVIVALHSGDTVGWGEGASWASPGYCPEYATSTFDVVERFLGPRIVGQTFDTSETLLAAMAHVKGNRFAKAAVEQAWWDLAAKRAGRPLWRTLGGRGPAVDVGADFGVMESIDALLDAVGRAVDAGFKRIKLKFRPGWDIEMVAAVRAAFADLVMHIDCNAAYTLTDAAMFEALDAYNLAMIEQPLQHDDLVDHAALQARLRTPICLDESITSPTAARQAIALQSCRVINVKPGRVGGMTPAIDIIRQCREADLGCWIGGMLESNIGAMHCLALATLDGITYPCDIFPSDRFYREDLADPPTRLAGPSRITAHDGPGIGVAVDRQRLERATLRSATLHAPRRRADREDYRIERATARDFIEIAALDHLVWRDHPLTIDGEHSWRIWCEHATMLVAREPSAHAIVGALLAFPGERGVDVLHKIFVHPHHRGRSLAGTLMRTFLAEQKRPVILTCDPTNQPALQTYERHGFTRGPVIEGYYRKHEHRYEMRWEPGAG